MASISGLGAAESDLYKRLLVELRRRQPRNLIRSAYMDGRRAAAAVSPMLPPYLRNVGAVLGWPAKAVESLSRRTRLEGFAAPGVNLADFGIPALLDDNQYSAEVRQTELSSLVHAVAWEIVTRGGPGEPDVLITSKTALDGTGTWNRRTRRLDDFLSVNEWHADGDPLDFALYLPGRTIVVEGRRVVSDQTHSLHVPVHPVRYKPRHDRVFGQSRISRPVMFLTDAAVRAMLRMEGTADFYGTPHLLLLGASLDQFSKEDGSAVNTWDFLMSKINGLPDDEQAVNPRAQVQQIAQASQQPHMAQLDTIAAAFAGETNIPVSSLGVGVHQANPTSAESYLASREDLIAESEDAADTWGAGHVRAVQDAWRLANGGAELPAELRGLRAVYQDPRQTSRAAAADATVKLVGAFPWMAESDALLGALGLPADLVERLRADKARARSSADLRALVAPGGVPAGPSEADEAAAMKAKFDALGVAIRSGVDPEQAAERIGLPGIRFTGAIPVSLRPPADEAERLEPKNGDAG